MIQQITIQIETPEGYEATGEYRFPRVGEPFMSVSGNAVIPTDADSCNRRMNRIILKKVWSFPAWFGNGWELRRDFVSPGTWTVHKSDFGRFMFADALWAFHGETFAPPTGIEKLQCVR